MDVSDVVLPDDELAFYQAIYESANLGICVTNDRGCFVRVNDTYCELFGYDRSELIGQPFTLVLPADEKAQAVQLHNEVLQGVANSASEWQAKHKDGSLLDVMITVGRIIMSDAQRFRVTTVLDITEHKQNEALLKAGQQQIERLSRIVSQSTNGVIITDPAGYIEWVNDGFTRISGFTLDQLIGRHPGECLQGPDTDPETIAHMRRQLQAGEDFQVDIVNYHQAGHTYWVHISCSPLRNDQGELEGFMALQTDITERKRAARLLVEQRTLYQAIVDTTSESLITIDANGSILAFNKAAERTFQYRAAEIVGTNIKRLMPAQFARDHDHHLQEYARTGVGRIIGVGREVTGR